jgi:hypothetical protein
MGEEWSKATCATKLAEMKQLVGRLAPELRPRRDTLRHNWMVQYQIEHYKQTGYMPSYTMMQKEAKGAFSAVDVAEPTNLRDSACAKMGIRREDIPPNLPISGAKAIPTCILNSTPVQHVPVAIAAHAKPPEAAQEDLNEAMEIVFADDPYSAQRTEVVRQRLYDLSHIMATFPVVEGMCKAKLTMLKGWKGRLLDRDERSLRNALRKRWMVSYVKDVYSTTGKLPSYKQMHAHSIEWLGSVFDSEVIRDYQRTACKDLGLTSIPRNLPHGGVRMEEATVATTLPAVAPLVPVALVPATPQDNAALDRVLEALTVTNAAIAAMSDRLDSIEQKLRTQAATVSPVAAERNLLSVLKELDLNGFAVSITSKS